MVVASDNITTFTSYYFHQMNFVFASEYLTEFGLNLSDFEWSVSVSEMIETPRWIVVSCFAESVVLVLSKSYCLEGSCFGLADTSYRR